nr:hypothetical protein [Deltaproteobacteria bacterium]
VHLSVAEGDCAAAEASWVLARRHLPNRRAWTEANDPSTALAECWARFSERARGTERVEALARAHRWDPRAKEFLRVSRGMGERLWLAGLSARDRRDWEASYVAFRDLLRFQPWRSWARRYAEEARDHRLGITD